MDSFADEQIYHRVEAAPDVLPNQHYSGARIIVLRHVNIDVGRIS